MARRYSQIKKGAEYEKALENYTTYLRNTDTRPTKRLQGGARGNRRQTVAAAVRPFGAELASGVYLSTRVGQESLTTLGGQLASRVFTQGAQLAGATKMAKFRPARVIAFRGSGAATYVPSKVTKLYYLKYEGDSYSAPFGATSDTEEEQAGGIAVKAAILTLFGAADIKRVSISPERVPV